MSGSIPRRFVLLQKFIKAQKGLEAEMALVILHSLWNDVSVLWGSDAMLSDDYARLSEELDK